MLHVPCMALTHIYSIGISALAEEQNIFTSNLHSYMCSWVNPFSFRTWSAVVLCSWFAIMNNSNPRFAVFLITTFWVKTSKATRLPGCASPPLTSILEVTSTIKLTVWQNICNYQITFCLWYWLCECTKLYNLPWISEIQYKTQYYWFIYALQMHSVTTERKDLWSVFGYAPLTQAGVSNLHHHWFRLLHPPCPGTSLPSLPSPLH